jgi:hypothetical protein
MVQVDAAVAQCAANFKRRKVRKTNKIKYRYAYKENEQSRTSLRRTDKGRGLKMYLLIIR